MPTLNGLLDRLKYPIHGVPVMVARERELRSRIDAMHESGIGLSPVMYTIKLLALLDLLPTNIRALEPFGMCGLRKTIDYVERCESLDLFEIEEVFANEARRQIPKADIHVRDSIVAIRNRELPRPDYNLVFIDNPTGVYADYCEHFEIVPEIFDSLANESILIINVLLDSWIDPNDSKLLHRRKQFYSGALETATDALKFYRALAESSGMCTTFSAIVPHPGNFMYLVQKLSRNNI